MAIWLSLLVVEVEVAEMAERMTFLEVKATAAVGDEVAARFLAQKLAALEVAWAPARTLEITPLVAKVVETAG
jgi:hypothetical protein